VGQAGVDITLALATMLLLSVFRVYLVTQLLIVMHAL